jgi:hypothetical protein
LNDGGEDWVLKKCWRSPTTFPLHSGLLGATPFLDEKEFRSYEGLKIPGVAIDKLSYFGASIFWRAAVRDWSVGKEKDHRLPLGPFEEMLRRYLMAETGMPDGVVLLVTLSTALDDLHNRVAVMPWLFNRTPEYRSYKFIVTGLAFQMFFGMMIPKVIRRICTARYGFLYMSEDRDDDLLRTMAKLSQSVEGKGTLAKQRQTV